MTGVIVESTVTAPYIGDTIIGQSIYEILPKASVTAYEYALYKAFATGKPQWCDYTVADNTFVVLVEWARNIQAWVVHQVPYDDNIHDIQLQLFLALNNYRQARG
ncbi:MAG: hypothetical protein DRH26_00690 [Deltaproteobacteria bacterium]|nr:MAG: hypothetical protein DRH26_00690 [Deltaproteobacteria bacterium]